MGTIWKTLCIPVIINLLFMSVVTMANENTDAVMESGLNVNTYTLNSIGNGFAEKESESNFPDYYSMIDNPMPASTFHNPVTLQEIEQESDTIIRGTFLGVIMQEEEYDPSFGTFVYGFTHSSIRVEEVYSGNVKVGDTIALFEPYYVQQRDNQTILSHHENYYPTKTDKSYIWFLSENAGSNYDAFWGLEPNKFYYSPLYCERGRYPAIDAASSAPVDVDNMSNRELDLSPSGSSLAYKKIYREVISKYLTKR